MKLFREQRAGWKKTNCCNWMLKFKNVLLLNGQRWMYIKITCAWDCGAVAEKAAERGTDDGRVEQQRERGRSRLCEFLSPSAPLGSVGFVLTLPMCCEVRKGIQHYTTSARGRVRVWCPCCWRRTPTSTFATAYVLAPSRPWTPPASAGSDLLFFSPQDGETPLDIATRLKFHKIVSLLRKDQ